MAREESAKIVVSHSIFIARVAEIGHENEARAFLVRAKELDPGADHYCYAYRLREGSAGVAHASDAGEPPGTAGRPILGALQAACLTNVVLTVARFFGGRKLGIPGLIEAYRAAAAAVLVKAGTVTRRPSRRMSMTVPYSLLDQVRRLLRVHGAEERAASYGRTVELLLSVPLENEAGLLRALADLGPDVAIGIDA